jgi:putative membrane protein
MQSPLQKNFPAPFLKRNDKKASILIWVVSIIVFIAVAFLEQVKFKINLAFNPHIFATINAFINSIVAILLIAALLAVKSNRYYLHKNLMIAAIILSILFLLSYICHHLLSGDSKYGDLNHDGILSADEKSLAGTARYIYYFILITHIPLAAIILPFILFTAYRALTGNYERHKKLARITWPIWFYVAVTGVIVYLMIRPYYN